jgi:hypothetical protein
VHLNLVTMFLKPLLHSIAAMHRMSVHNPHQLARALHQSFEKGDEHLCRQFWV